MGVRPVDRRRPSVQIISHRQLFRRRIGVNLTHRNVIPAFLLTQNAVGTQKRVVRPVLHITPPDQVHDQNAPARRIVNAVARAGRLRSQIGRTQNIPVIVQIWGDILFAQGMVSQRDDIRA